MDVNMRGDIDHFMYRKVQVQRLYADYCKHGTLIVAVDFDNTIYDFHKKGLTFNTVVYTLHQCNALDLSVVIFTATDDYDLVYAQCDKLGIRIKGVNIDLLPQFASSRKMYYNILLDDRAGLFEAYCILRECMDMIRNEAIKN